MARDGVAGTSMDAVRAATRTSKSQLYHYFVDKDDLVVAVIRHHAGAVVAAQRLADDPPGDPAGLQRWRYRVVAAQRARGFSAGCPLGSLVGELAGSGTTDTAVRAALVAAFDHWRGRLEAGLRRGLETGALRAALDAGAAAEHLVAAVEGGSVLAALADGPAPLQAALDRAIEDLLALAPSEPRGR